MCWNWIPEGYGMDFGELLCTDYFFDYGDVYGKNFFHVK